MNLLKKDTVSENTHFNKNGAWLITKGLVNLIKSVIMSRLQH